MAGVPLRAEYVASSNTYLLFRGRQEVGMAYPDKNLIKLHPSQYTIERIDIQEELEKAAEQAKNISDAMSDFVNHMKGVTSCD